jgi:uncharacterized damage-inducible protein DinB
MSVAAQTKGARYVNYYGSKELARSFRTVRNNTIQTAEDIPTDQYGFAPAQGTKTVSQTLVHIALFPRLQLTIHAKEPRTSFEGFDFPAFVQQLTEEESKDRTKAQVIDLLTTEGEQWACFLEGVTQDFLAEPFGMPPGATPASKSRFEMLLSVKEHEMHHRSQLAVSQRLLGIVPHLTKLREAHIAELKADADVSS